MNKNDYGGCQRELGPAVQHHSLAVWTLRSHHTPLSRGEASSVSRRWTGDSETLIAEGHDTKGFSKHQGQISHTCAFKYANRHITHAQVHLHIGLCHTMCTCTQAYDTYIRAPAHRHTAQAHVLLHTGIHHIHIHTDTHTCTWHRPKSHMHVHLHTGIPHT